MANIQPLAPQPLTGGNNPWLDAISYNARWQPGRHRETKLSIFFLSPKQLANASQIPQIAQRLADQSARGWLASDPVDSISRQQKHDILRAYSEWSKVCKIRVEEAASPFDADIVFAAVNFNNTSFQGTSSQALASHQGLLVPSNSEIEYALPEPSPLPLIAEFNSTYFNEVNQDRDLFRFVMLHEIGHGLGLSHPHDQGLGSVVKPIFPGTSLNDPFSSFGEGLFSMNNINRTIMSYSTGYGQADASAPGRALPTTPMALDIMAVQLKYGHRPKSDPDDTTYALAKQIGSNPKWSCIYDTNGYDRITARNLSEDITISLVPAFMTDANRVDEDTWGVWGKWATVLDLISSLTASVPGSIRLQGENFDYGLVRYMDLMAENKYTRTDLVARLNYMKRLIGDYSPKSLSNAVQDMYLLSAASGIEGLYHYLEKNGADRIGADGIKTSSIRDFANAAINFIEYVNQYLSSIPLENTMDQLLNQLSTAMMGEGIKYIGGSLSGITRQPQPQSTSVYSDWIESASSYNIASSVDSAKGGYSIAAGVDIESAVGGSGNDILIGFWDSRLNGLAGGDTLQGFVYDDILKGGKGPDTLFGHAGNDMLMGGAGDDYLFPHLSLEAFVSGDDYCDGGRGEDMIILDGFRSDYSLSPTPGVEGSFIIRSLLNTWSASVANIESVSFSTDVPAVYTLDALLSTS